MDKTILTDIFEKTVPLSLHNVKLFKENKLNYSLVGGLVEAKQILTETIIWPSVVSKIIFKYLYISNNYFILFKILAL